MLLHVGVLTDMAHFCYVSFETHQKSPLQQKKTAITTSMGDLLIGCSLTGIVCMRTVDRLQPDRYRVPSVGDVFIGSRLILIVVPRAVGILIDRIFDTSLLLYKSGHCRI